MNKSKGFTLVELLVVIGIIALLISILLPALNKARESAVRVACASNHRQVMMAVMMYADDYDSQLPGIATEPREVRGKHSKLHPAPPANRWGPVGLALLKGYLGDNLRITDLSMGELYSARGIISCPAPMYDAPKASGEGNWASMGYIAYFQRKSTDPVIPVRRGDFHKRAYTMGWLLGNPYANGAAGLRGFGNHKGEGDNVGYGDGHVEWFPSKLVEVRAAEAWLQPNHTSLTRMQYIFNTH